MTHNSAAYIWLGGSKLWQPELVEVDTHITQSYISDLRKLEC